MTIGSGVKLRESPHRSDLLEIESQTSSWGGISISNSSNEHVVNFMADGTKWGIFEDLDNEWHIYGTRNGGVQLNYNGNKRLETTGGGVTVSGTLEATGVASLDSVAFENKTSDPTAVEGKLYYNSTDKEFKYYNGSSWKTVGGAILG